MNNMVPPHHLQGVLIASLPPAPHGVTPFMDGPKNEEHEDVVTEVARQILEENMTKDKIENETEVRVQSVVKFLYRCYLEKKIFFHPVPYPFDKRLVDLLPTGAKKGWLRKRIAPGSSLVWVLLVL